MRWAKLSGMAAVAVVSALLTLPGEIVAVSAHAAPGLAGTSFAPTDDPAADCVTDPGNPACAPASPPDQAPLHHRRRSPGVVVGPPLAPFNMPPSIR
jgi:hypothetical protein